MNSLSLQIFRMQNPVQDYSWGSRTAIAQLMGNDAPSARPQAELWMGSHIKSTSKVWYDDRWHSLRQLIAQLPDDMLGPQVASRFNQSLPYLFKVLAAAEPLSIQAHPDQEQARVGFRRENQHAIALDAPQRNYKDDQPKPECICALTEFWGLCGFRSLADMVSMIGPVWPLHYSHGLSLLKKKFNHKGLQLFFQYLMGLETKQRNELVTRIADKAEGLKKQNSAYDWIHKLIRRYPGDIGVLSPLLLNVIKLEPGQALFLPPCQLHSYLDGLGIEIMGNSDNVLRGGLTPKHIDVDELVRIVDFNPYNPEIMQPRSHSDTEKIYPSSTEAFALAELVPRDDRPHKVTGRSNGPEIILGIEGTARISWMNSAEEITIEPGQSVFVPAAVDSYVIQGNARMYKAAANL